MAARLEHANLTVRNVDETIRFLRTAFPDFQIRFDDTDACGRRWVHVGTDETYIALTQSSAEPEPGSKGGKYLNHLAYEVDNAEELRERFISAGFKESIVPNNHPNRKQVYFYDPDGYEWEFVQYLTDDPLKRNDYTLPDGEFQ